MIADRRCLQFLGFIEDRQVGEKPLGTVYLEEETQGLQVVTLEIGVLSIGLIRQQFQEGHHILLNIVHYLGLFITDVQGTGCPVPGRS